MRRLLLLITLFSALTVSGQPKRYLGGDVSMIPSYENQGTVYKDFDGKPVRLLPFLKKQGCASSG
jgi:arabinogalactan endo-1,4-beta-galactosidase